MRDGLTRRPRRQHLTPTTSSWLNQVQRFFALLTEKQIRRGVRRRVGGADSIGFLPEFRTPSEHVEPGHLAGGRDGEQGDLGTGKARL